MRKHSLRFAAATLLLSVAAGYVLVDRWQRGLIFSVELGESRWWREPPQGTEVFDIELDNGDTLRTWYLPAAAPDAPTVLYLHGSRWNLNSSTFRIERWADMGYAILAIDYRGFGESSERLPSQDSAVQDASAALRELARRQPLVERRFVYGHSLGGAIAVALASQDKLPAFNGLILESTFTSIRGLVPYSRLSAIPGLSLLITQPFDSLSGIRGLSHPLLLLHGSGDRVVPPTMSEALYQAADGPSQPLRRFVLIQGGSHSSSSAHPEYRAAVRAFIDEAIAQASG